MSLSVSSAFPDIIPGPAFLVEDSGQDLARKTVCIKVQRTRLGNSRKVSSSQVDVDTDKTMLRVSKRLFDCPQYKAIGNFDADISRYLESVCLPFEKGVHLCPVRILANVDGRLKNFAAQRPALVEDFVQAYPDLCSQAPDRFRALHDPTDFLPVDQVREAFTFSWRYISFGVPEKLREVSSQLWEEEKSKLAQLMTDAAAEAQQVMRAAMAELVQHLANRLQDGPDGKPVRLHKTAVSKLLEFLDTFEFRNVTNDEQLKDLVHQARSLMQGIGVDQLKTGTMFREQVRSGMQNIASKLDTMLVRGGRKIRFEED